MLVKAKGTTGNKTFLRKKRNDHLFLSCLSANREKISALEIPFHLLLASHRLWPHGFFRSSISQNCLTPTRER
jgi:hypothetical protein